MPLCIKCKREFATARRLRICDECLSVNTRRQRRPRITPKNLARGTRWSYNRVPNIKGVLNAVHTGGYVHVQIDDEHGDFTWISTVDDFLLSWTKINSGFSLDLNGKSSIVHVS